MREWSSLTDAFLDTLTDNDNFTDLADAWSEFITREERCEMRDAYAVSRGIPSIFDDAEYYS
jgi:hypothetical protein